SRPQRAFPFMRRAHTPRRRFPSPSRGSRIVSCFACAALVCIAALAAAATKGGACRRACRAAQLACIQQGKQLTKQECKLSTARRACRQRVLRTTKARCHGFLADCKSCCDEGGSACDARCGDGVVTAIRGEQCDPPGSPCAGSNVCDA